MRATYKDVLDKLGVTKWHEKGYYGQGIVLGSWERVKDGIFDDVEVLKKVTTDSGFTSHGTTVMEILTKVCPQAHRVSVYSSYKISKGQLMGDCIDWLHNNKLDVLTTSEFGDSMSRPIFHELWQELISNGTFLCCAAGNVAENGTQNLGDSDLWKLIGACTVAGRRTYYSSVSEHLDFMSISDFMAEWDGLYKQGTSFSSPMFAGLIALIQCFFKLNTGRVLSLANLDRFIKDNCVDLGKEGRDDNYGYGLLILPDPDTIDISKYQEGVDMKIRLKIDNRFAEVDGRIIKLDQEPIIKNDRTLVPVRFIAEALGCKVEWDDKNREVIITKE